MPLTERLVTGQREALGHRLVGVYLFGSSTTGRFEPGISDVDTLAVLSTEPTDGDVSTLATMHEHLAEQAPAWRDRIEVDYVSAQALAQFRSHPWSAARISPGEPLHRIDIDRRWVIDWYQVRTAGIALLGPPPHQLIPPISRAEFLEAVRSQVAEWPDRITRSMTGGELEYAVLTLCRALRACSTGDYVSKKEAALWAIDSLPEFRDLVTAALGWRYGKTPASGRPQHRDEVLRFCEVVMRRCSSV